MYAARTACPDVLLLSRCRHLQLVATAITLLATLLPARAQDVYQIDVRNAQKEILRGHLDLGGTNPQGDSIGFTSYFMELNGKPVIPVVGEFHYSRYPSEYWDESLRKMKAGGIDVVATYVFWNIHEEKEGRFEWGGDRNLRRFIELVAKNGLQAIVRIGPFDHGEIRNGGLPDWLYGRPFSVRSNDADYLAYVNGLYREIARQLEGLYYKDGGPIIGIQIENEYQHSAAPWAFAYPGQPQEWTVAERDSDLILEGVGIQRRDNPYAKEGQGHMEVLKNMALQAGMDVPLYTATGWGNAAIVQNGSIPVTAGYAYPTWAPPAASPFYLFKDLHSYPDYSPVSYEPELYPSFAAELGGGIQITYSRRPTIPPQSLEALIVRELGSGANGIGYYMYHGGSTPRGEGYYFADEAIGVPRINYDFQAPIGEYGQLRPSFHRLKLLHYFLDDFQARLAPTVTVLPETAAGMTPSNVDELRYAVRVQGETGFIFMLNYQDHVDTHDLTDLQLEVQTDQSILRIPKASTFTLRSGESTILPFNLDIGALRMNYATAQPFSILDHGDTIHHTYVAIEGIPPEFAFKAVPEDAVTTTDCRVQESEGVSYVRCAADRVSHFALASADNQVTFAVFPKSLALQANRVTTDDGERLVFSEATILEKDGLIEVLSRGKNRVSFSVYPRLDEAPRLRHGSLLEAASDHPALSSFTLTMPAVAPNIRVSDVAQNRLTVDVDSLQLGGFLNDVFIEIDYTGDTGMGFIDGRLVADHFWHAQPWSIGLKRFFPDVAREGMYFYFRPLYPDAPFLIDLPASSIPDLQNRNARLTFEGIQVVPEYRAVVAF